MVRRWKKRKHFFSLTTLRNFELDFFGSSLAEASSSRNFSGSEGLISLFWPMGHCR